MVCDGGDRGPALIGTNKSRRCNYFYCYYSFCVSVCMCVCICVCVCVCVILCGARWKQSSPVCKS